MNIRLLVILHIFFSCICFRTSLLDLKFVHIYDFSFVRSFSFYAISRELALSLHLRRAEAYKNVHFSQCVPCKLGSHLYLATQKESRLPQHRMQPLRIPTSYDNAWEFYLYKSGRKACRWPLPNFRVMRFIEKYKYYTYIEWFITSCPISAERFFW
jgi:hypothetical protein